MNPQANVVAFDAAKVPALQMAEGELLKVLKSSLYPGAADESIKMVLGYCKAAGYDPMQKPVHIVPMWDNKTSSMRDVIMPGVGLYRTQAARTGQFAGMTEPEFGPDVTENLGGVNVTYPQWCRVTVKRLLTNGQVAEFTAREFWKENYAVKGGKEKSIAPNAMWMRRVYGQLAKCAQAQALRLAFPEAIGADATADEMEGKTLGDAINITPQRPPLEGVQSKSEKREPQTFDQPADAKPAEKAADKPAEGSTTSKPMADGQKRILRAKMNNAGLTDVDLKAKFNMGLDDPEAAWTFDHFAAVQDWIIERQANA